MDGGTWTRVQRDGFVLFDLVYKYDLHTLARVMIIVTMLLTLTRVFPGQEEMAVLKFMKD